METVNKYKGGGGGGGYKFNLLFENTKYRKCGQEPM